MRIWFREFGQNLQNSQKLIHLRYFIDHNIFLIRYPRLFWVYHKKHETLTDNSSIRIYINKIENKITFKINAVIFSTLNTWNNEIIDNNIDKDKTGENVSHLEITEVILVHCNLVDNS